MAVRSAPATVLCDRLPSETDTIAETKYEYDGKDQLVAFTDPEGRRETYTYDRNSNLTKTSPVYHKYTRFLPSCHHPPVRSFPSRFPYYPEGRRETYTYDRNSNLTKTVDKNGNTLKNVVKLFSGTFLSDRFPSIS